MERRAFLAAGAAAAVAGGAAAQESTPESPEEKRPVREFKLKYAPHFGMFKHTAGNDLIDQLQYMRDQGFTAFEDNWMINRPVDEQDKLAKELERLKIEMGVFVGFSGFGKNEFVTRTDKEYQGWLRKEAQRMTECGKRVNAQWTTVVPGDINNSLEHDYMMANCVENLKVLSEECEKTGLIMALEPLNWWANHPNLFLTKIPQAYLICKAVGSPSCKILDDLYHQQISEGNLIPNMEKAWDEIAYIQVGDNPGRKEPTTGEINYKNIFKWLRDKGYQGIVGMEHGNSRGGKEGEQAVIDAYVEVDNF